MSTFRCVRVALGLLCAHLLLGLGSAQAGELIYTPVNPTFGGNPNNAGGLMSTATAQNEYKAPVKTKSALERFTANLETAMLNRLSSAAVNSLFDADGNILPDRTVTAGNYVISVTHDAGGNLILTTTDTTNPGASTRIVLGNVVE